MRPRSHATVKIPVAGAAEWHTLSTPKGVPSPATASSHLLNPQQPIIQFLAGPVMSSPALFRISFFPVQRLTVFMDKQTTLA